MTSAARAPRPGDVVPIDLRRRSDARLQVSRITADLFWRDGVARTRGEDIAAAAGISTRTLWRYFRSKEACVEPVLVAFGEPFLRFLESWPPGLSVEDHMRAGSRPGRAEFTADQVRAMHVVHLGLGEPALRSAWLMVCDDVERRCVPIVAARLGLRPDDPDALRITAALGGANRALSDAITADYLHTGVAPQAAELRRAVSHAIGEASGGRLGGPVAAHRPD